MSTVLGQYAEHVHCYVRVADVKFFRKMKSVFAQREEPLLRQLEAGGIQADYFP